MSSKSIYTPVYCSCIECRTTSHQNVGKALAARQIKRSKDEIDLYNLCKEHFNHVDNNIPLFNGWDADSIIHDIKLAILWNGPWHYKDMPGLKHSLKQVQNRDKIKEIQKAGWEYMIFEDHTYTPQTAFQIIINGAPCRIRTDDGDKNLTCL